MAYLIDTNLLVRLANVLDPDRAIAAQAVFVLRGRGETVGITSQNLIEFRAVATRPVISNGLGFSLREAEEQAADFEAVFPLLDETPAIFPAWKALVGAAGVIGKQVHDARLVAVCHAHGVTHLLTFNSAHFLRLAGFGPWLVVVHPADV